MDLPGKHIRKTRWVRTDQFAVAVEVDAILLDSDPSELVYGPETVQLLREVEAHALSGDLAWLQQHGKVYAAVEAG